MTNDNAAEEPKWVQSSKALAPWATLIVMTIGGCWAYRNVTKKITDSSLRLQEAQKKNVEAQVHALEIELPKRIAKEIAETKKAEVEAEKAALELAHQKTPTLDMKVCASPRRLFSLGHKKPGVSLITLEAHLENLGFAPIPLGDMKLEVYKASIGSDLEKVLQHIERSIDDNQLGEPTRRPAPDAFTSGELYPISADNTKNVTWLPCSELTKEQSLDRELKKSQEVTLPFEFVMAESSYSTWYRFDVTVKPPEKDSWQESSRQVTAPGGGILLENLSTCGYTICSASVVTSVMAVPESWEPEREPTLAPQRLPDGRTRMLPGADPGPWEPEREPQLGPQLEPPVAVPAPDVSLGVE
ncbi:hypothetical protein ACFL5Q_06695 [Planctomycetota bacterium]